MCSNPRGGTPSPPSCNALKVGGGPPPPPSCDAVKVGGGPPSPLLLLHWCISCNFLGTSRAPGPKSCELDGSGFAELRSVACVAVPQVVLRLL